MWRRRNERGSLGWFEFRTRAGVYVLLTAVPVLAVVLGVQHQVRVPGLAVFLLLSVAQAGVCIALLHAGLGRYLAAGPQPKRWLVASAAALTAAGVLAGAAAFPAFTVPSGTAFPVSMLVAMLFSGALIVALTPLLSLRALTILVLGQMLQVRQVAHDSLREMRAVVSGYRAADLGTELAGAQDVLRSAGMSCRVTGDAAGLPADVQAALGWVVREGTTNIIRHSDATACTIELGLLDSPGAPRTVTLRMDNDRVHTPDTGSGGSGLAGLGERLAGLGGSITTGHPRTGHFRLEASLPACGTTSVPPGPAQRGTGVTPETPAP